MTVGCSYLKTLQSTICAAKANDGIDMIMMQMFSEDDFGYGVSIKDIQNHAMFSLNVTRLKRHFDLFKLAVCLPDERSF